MPHISPVRLIAALSVGLTAIMPSTAKAGQDIFHIFTPAVEAGSWGAEALSGVQIGLPNADDHEPIRAAHELAIHRGINDFWMAKLALGLERPSGDDYDFSSLALENVFRFYRPAGTSLDAAWFTSLSMGIDGAATNSVEFGPVISYAGGPISLVFNPFFERKFGDNREPGIAFTYGWRAVYRASEFYSVGMEGYGAIEDLESGPAFEDQIHRFGPVLYLGHLHGDTHGIHGSEHAVHGRSGEEEWHGEIGVLFGLTETTSDATIKLNIGADF